MITLCIRYTIDIQKHADFEQYARNWPEPIRRCGGDLVGYFLPTKLAGATNLALALINFPNLARLREVSREPDERHGGEGECRLRRSLRLHSD